MTGTVHDDGALSPGRPTPASPAVGLMAPGPTASGPSASALPASGLAVSGLAVSGLTLSIGSSVLVDRAAFAVPTGTVTALIGPNGAGKSTLLRMMGGAASADDPGAGTVQLGTRDLLRLPRRERARTVALLEQQVMTEFSVTVEQVVALGRIPYDHWWSADKSTRQVVPAVMERAGVTEWSDRVMNTLSGGEQQRVHLARALAQQPRLLLLDEPTNHLDISAQLELFALLRELAHDEGLTVVVALHDIAAAVAHCDHAVVMDQGRVVSCGSVDDTLDPDLLQQVYGVRVDVVTHPRTGRPVTIFSRIDDTAASMLA